MSHEDFVFFTKLNLTICLCCLWGLTIMTYWISTHFPADLGWASSHRWPILSSKCPSWAASWSSVWVTIISEWQLCNWKCFCRQRDIRIAFYFQEQCVLVNQNMNGIGATLQCHVDARYIIPYFQFFRLWHRGGMIIVHRWHAKMRIMRKKSVWAHVVVIAASVGTPTAPPVQVIVEKRVN